MKSPGSIRYAAVRGNGRIRRSSGAFALALLVGALMLSGCGTSKDADSSGSGDSTAKESPTPLKSLYAGQFEPPPSTGPKAVPGKTVWYVSCGQAFRPCAMMAEAFSEAGKALGWNVAVKDGKADPAAASSIIRSAIVAHVDGVVVADYECPNIKGALQEAKAAGLPVASMLGPDCNNPIYDNADSEKSLFSFTPKLRNFADPLDFWRAWAAARADFVVDKVGKNAKILYINETSYASQRARYASFVNRLDRVCPSCKVKNVEWNFAQVPSPASQIWQTAIQSNSDYNVVIWGLDSLPALGLESALATAGVTHDLVGGGEGGSEVAFQLIRDKKADFSAAVDYRWESWAAADDLNRLFAGADPAKLPNQGSGWQFVDKGHNLPAADQIPNPPVDYEAAYRAIWGS